MSNKKIGLITFIVGVLALHMNATIGFFWLLSGLPVPAAPEHTSGIEVLLSGFITPLGALMMVIGGAIYGYKKG